MAEDDEIDILGDFNLDSFLTKNDSAMYENASLVSQNSELLDCDYTIHPQWLLDKPSANPDCWYGANSSLEDFVGGDSDNMGHVSTENSISDESGWTEKEKNLLERGIEIFGKSNVRLSQFIGSRTPSEVKYYLKNFYTEAQSTYSSFNAGMMDDLNIVNNLVSDILVDTQIPASIEEVIAAVSTAKPTVQQRKKPTCDPIEQSNKIRAMETHSKKKTKSKGKNTVKFKIKTQLKFPMNQIRQKTIKIMNQNNKKAEFGKVEITTGKGLSVPICEGEQIVKISKDDSDVEIDVEDEDNEVTPVLQKVEKVPENIPIRTEPLETIDSDEIPIVIKQTKSFIDISTLSEDLVKELLTLEKPTNENTIIQHSISELEKVVHSEFFEGRPTKTPSRYLKIRNHIIDCWKNIKPNYVTKTSIRHGLKNCGDVNCISRIHCYLEQTGIINFGCRQTKYTRPLFDVFQAMLAITREKPMKDSKNLMKLNLEMGSRPRIKRRFANDGEGGCTLTHDEKGDVINTTIVNEEPPKPKPYIKKQAVRLIYCRPFPEGHSKQHKVRMSLSTLLLMDFHAHTSLTEVMGLVAGEWDPHRKTLTVSHYEPCRNIASSATHCDMCPISQSKAAELIHGRGLDVIGWFHSHPTFAPEPSQQDLETQQDMQRWIGPKNPCVGLILSPFSAHGALIASPFRCIAVDRKENFEDQFVPYKFHLDVVVDDLEVEGFLADFRTMFGVLIKEKQSQVEFDKPYFQDSSISYLEKYVTSVRMHLAKCGTLSKMMCDCLIEGVRETCSRH